MTVDPRRDTCLLPLAYRPAGCPFSFTEGATFGTPPDYTEFGEDGFMTAYGDGRAWIDYNFGVGNVVRGAAAPDLINLNATNILVAAYNGVNILEEVHFGIELNHNWAEGTIIYPHVHWYPTTAAAGNVIWNLEYVLVNRTETGVIGAASTTIQTTQAAGGTAWAPRFVNFPTITTTNFLIGTQAHFRFYRDPNIGGDTYGADAATATVGLHVLINTIGSSKIGEK